MTTNAPDGQRNCLTSKSGFKSWSPLCKLVAGTEDERFTAFVEWVEARDTNAPTMVPETMGAVSVQRLAQHVRASQLISTETGSSLHRRQQMGEHIVEAWMRLVQRFGPAPALTNLALMSNILNLPDSNTDNISLLRETRPEMVRQDQ